MTSSDVIMPRSPWLASAACTKKAGVPVEASVAAILRAICPDLPSPVTITRPRAARMVSTAAANGAARLSAIAAVRAASPSDSVSRVRNAETRYGFEAGFGFLASDALIVLLPAKRHDNKPGGVSLPASSICPKRRKHPRKRGPPTDLFRAQGWRGRHCCKRWEHRTRAGL